MTSLLQAVSPLGVGGEIGVEKLVHHVAHDIAYRHLSVFAATGSEARTSAPCLRYRPDGTSGQRHWLMEADTDGPCRTTEVFDDADLDLQPGVVMIRVNAEAEVAHLKFYVSPECVSG